ncbi:hypothetical protein [Psychrobium sp. 1_MG-2023]|uniref:hypothetical protein n=1 Tax=Psychrobium sp. 1_MG-2023 TaxID=3062624 RepID=UPI000C31C1C9|nr:hypothetical protein [Psychrobium sp. 1_MG-2023]MDP2562823.1 hypothetical protein [Psychrobium sp. 1_MG-2023]PKF57957.1 hypothetical protein CW748_05405 [Alteromonadales bacterium alter-6D02]
MKKLFLLVIALISMHTYADQLSNDFTISGFGRVVGGQLFKNDYQYNGYTNEFDFGQESLFSVQIDGKITDKISATGQLLLHASDSRRSGVEWAYLSYHHNDNLHFKLGKLRTPFFNYSDVMDVGFVYPWINPPNQVYSEYVFSTFEGANVTYNVSLGDNNYFLEGYWGRFDDSVFVEGEEFNPKVKNLRGMVFNLERDNLSYRLSYHVAHVNSFQKGIDDLSQQLAGLGFAKSAKSLVSIGNVHAVQAGVSYHSLDYFARAEWMRIDSDLLIFPETQGYYATLGYNFTPFAVHFTFANHDSSFGESVQEIPLGIAPELNMLSAVYNSVFDYLSTSDVKSYTLGLRYDIQTNIALKADISWLEGCLPEEHRSVQPAADMYNQAAMLQLGVEWIF